MWHDDDHPRNDWEPHLSQLEPWNRHWPITQQQDQERGFFRAGIRPISAGAWIAGAVIAFAIGMAVFFSNGCNARQPSQPEMRRDLEAQRAAILQMEREWHEFEARRRKFSFDIPAATPLKRAVRQMPAQPQPRQKEKTAK